MQKYAKSLKKYFDLSNYLSAAQIYLKDNALLERELQKSDIKPRLLGHWGTTPGINLVYGTINAAIIENEDLEFLYIVGPGHGFPAYQAGTFLDRSLSYFYPKKIPYNKKGVEEIVYKFSVPYGFPSHLNPESPGVILEGGELGYSLSTAFGAAFDNENLVVTCLIGDGEAETATLQASWQINRFWNPARDGFVLPILHLNGYKISGPTVFSSFTDEELKSFFESLNFEVFIVDYEKGSIFKDILSAYEKSLQLLRSERKRFRQNKDAVRPKLPVIILKTPKGLTGPKELCGKKIEGNSLSHQVIFKNPAKNYEEFKALKKWLSSYHVEELIKKSFPELVLDPDIQKIIPPLKRSIGYSKYARSGAIKTQLPDIEKYSFKLEQEGGGLSDDTSMDILGDFLREFFDKNEGKFRLFSPDEAESNRIEEVFDETKKVWLWPIKPWENTLSKDGRIVSVLSEHILFGMLQGYTLTGRYGFFVTYEAFAQIVSSMLDQYVKFIKQAKKVSWRKPVPPLNIVLSSLLERQDHNGFSHQNPSFIADNLDRDIDIVKVYFPADQNILLRSLEKAMQDYNKVNIFVVGKRNRNVYLDFEAAKQHVFAGASIWEDYSDSNPDIIIATAGDYINRESIEGIKILKSMFPNIKVRLVNFNQLDILENESLCDIEFLLGTREPVLFNYHGYPSSIKKMLFGNIKSSRVIVNGYREEGSTTTPFDMLARNGLSRYDTVKDALVLLQRFGKVTFFELEEAHAILNKKIKEAIDYAKEFGEDLPELRFPE